MVSVKFGVETKDIKKVRKEIINVLMFHLPIAYQDFIVLDEVESCNTEEPELVDQPTNKELEGEEELDERSDDQKDWEHQELLNR